VGNRVCLSAAVCVICTLTACGASPAASVPAPIKLPTFQDGGGGISVSSATVGTLRVAREDGRVCFWIEPNVGGRGPNFGLVWPAGTVAVRAANSYRIVNKDGRQIAAVGEVLRFAGSQTESLDHCSTSKAGSLKVSDLQ